MLETSGFSTVAIALVRHQIEQVRPPRGLWTPFQLGRPLGEPGNAAFQRRVLRHALGLLERTDGPVILEDFPEDAPNQVDTPGWQSPRTTRPTGHDAQAFAEELQSLQAAWHGATQRFGRTTVGLSGQDVGAWPAFIEAVLRGELPTVPLHGTTALAMRFLADDIKALYSEAAQATGPAPSARQIDDWFWSDTAAGQTLRAVREAATSSENNALKTVGGRFFVPTPFLAA